MDYSQRDRDLAIRTMLGEAADQGDTGLAAVASVIQNRLKSGNYGDSASQIVLAPGQFEPWHTRAKSLAAISPQSAAYQRAGQLFDQVASGTIKDPTNGATHFLQPDIVRARTGGTLPDWAQGPGQRIGAHVFYKPDEPTDYLNVFKRAGETAPAESPAASTNATADAPDYLSTFMKASQAAPVVPHQQMIGDIPFNEADLAKPATGQQGPTNEAEKAISEASTLPGRIASDYFGGVNQNMQAAGGQIATGLSQIAGNQPASGIGNVAMGAIGYPGAVISGAENPLEKLTGNKDFASKATLLAPTGPLGKIANEARPVVSAANDIIRDVGVENLPTVIKRLENNPKLTVMDVAPAVQGNAAGLATDARNAPAMSQLNQFQRQRMNERKADTTGAFEDVLGPTPNVADTVQELKDQAAKTGKEVIQPAIDAMKPVDVSPVVANIDKQFNPAVLDSLKKGETPALPMTEGDKLLWKLRERVAGPEDAQMSLEPQRAHEIQQELRTKYGDSFDARQIRRDLVNQMEASSAPGQSFKAAQKQFAGDKQIEGAFQHGFDVFANPTGAANLIENHPDMWKAWAADASQPELNAVKKGILVGADTRIKNMRNGTMIPEGGFTHERIASIVGDDAAQKIVDKLNDWRDISQTDNVLTKNSATALRQAGQQNRSVRDVGGPGALQRYTPSALLGSIAGYNTGSPLVGGLAVAGLSAAQRGAQYAGKLHDIASNTNYAKWASAQGAKRDELLDIMREAARKAQPVSKSQKLMNLVPPSVLQALPQ
jgi:hypothetical protein